MSDQSRPTPPAGYTPENTESAQTRPLDSSSMPAPAPETRISDATSEANTTAAFAGATTDGTASVTSAATPGQNIAAQTQPFSGTAPMPTATPAAVSSTPAASAAPVAPAAPMPSQQSAPSAPATPNFVPPADAQPRFNTYSSASYTQGSQSASSAPSGFAQSTSQPGASNFAGTTSSFSSTRHTSPAAHSAANPHLKTFGYAFGGAALACVIALAGFSGYNALTGHTSAGSVVIGNTNPAQIANDGSEDRAEAVANKVLPSVVGVDIFTNQSSGFFSNQSSDSYTEAGLGSGVIISSDGYILTNNHVVEDADKLKVTANGESYDAKVVGTDPSSDLAVIKIDAQGLTPIEIGSSANINTGEWVMTAGSPFGLEQSVATGIISATSRTVTMDNSSQNPYGMQSAQTSSIYPNMIQTDAAINPGNSGGALVDADGKLIGINSVIESYSGNYSGVGFAIPVDYAMNIAQQIIDGKTPTHAQLGVGAVTVNAQTASRYNLGVNEGAYVSTVNAGSGAEAAGLQEGDIITKVNDTAVDSATELIAQVRSHNPGEQVEVTYVRDGETKTTSVTLGSDEDIQKAQAQRSSLDSSSNSQSDQGQNGWGNMMGNGQDSSGMMGNGQSWGDMMGN